MSGLDIAKLVKDEEIEMFERDGAVCLRSMFKRHWLDSLARGVERNMADPSPDGVRYTPDGGPGGFRDDYCNWDRIDEYREFVFNSPAGGMVGRLTGSKRVRLFHEHVLVKEPGTLEITPWHQDLPYFCVDGEKLCSLWLPLDPVPRNGCVEFVAGSHRWGKMFLPRKFISHEYYDYASDDYEPIPDIEANRDDYRILSWDLDPGDCIVFHMRMLHGAPGTMHLKTRRRAFSTRWLGDDAVFARRPGKTSPPFEGLDLEPGQPMDRPIFPVVWEA
ncbi:MAG: phytanoyl-CoA dioxygenase family protein [Acidobacteria bacterium]|nr:phytanoyl-CoA dioxygenase family protein [Acidobacteriota bacterium]